MAAPRAGAAIALVAGGYLLQSIREGGLALPLAGVIGGGALAFLVHAAAIAGRAAIAVFRWSAALAITQPGRAAARVVGRS